jgi:PERQ amino acid-rich with GYF domain-containing protein
MYKAVSSQESNGDVSRLFVSRWEPGHSNGSNGRGWGKGVDTRDHNNGPDACWDQHGHVKPISLEEMSAEEQMVC